MNSYAPGASLYRYDSTSNDVYLNLAREEYLFDALPDESRALLFYVDSSAVVYGKHQNPWRECSVRELERRGIPLARRISGGGTVYHDLGNLNFSFILPKEGFDRRANLALVVRALRRIGVKATISDRHDLLLDGRKISGNAFCFRHDRALHHGTLLVHARLDLLLGALVGTPGIESFAVRSNPSPVVNIADLAPAVELRALADAIAEEAAREWGGELERIEDRGLAAPGVEQLERRNRSVEWLLDRTPDFTVSLEMPGSLVGGSDGVVHLRLRVSKGRITADSTALDEGEAGGRVDDALRRIVGLRFDSTAIADALGPSADLAPFARWLRGFGF